MSTANQPDLTPLGDCHCEETRKAGRRGNPIVKKEIASQASPDRNDMSNLKQNWGSVSQSA